MKFYDFEVKKSDQSNFSLGETKGDVVLVVNVASKCGFTPQYEGLEKLHEQYGAQGLRVLGFPCNQFGGQEPGSADEIQSFCTLNYGVKFPVMAKVDVNGANASPFFEFLKNEAPGLLGTKAIKWNFTKFLIGRDGRVIERFAPNTKPEELVGSIEKALAATV